MLCSCYLQRHHLILFLQEDFCALQRSPNPALALLSGGLDSAAALALAREAHSFDHGRREASHEIKAANRAARACSADDHRAIAVDPGAFRGSSALTSQGDADKAQAPKSEGMLDGNDALKERKRKQQQDPGACEKLDILIACCCGRRGESRKECLYRS